MKIILDLCGGTGAWSKRYKDNGYDVIVITLPNHNVLNIKIDNGILIFIGKPNIYVYLEKVYGILAAPPCPHFSFCRTNAKKPRDLEGAMQIVNGCLHIVHLCQYHIERDTQKRPPLRFWALENPNRGMLKWFLGEPSFIFHPYDFGDNYKKETALWGMFVKPAKAPIKCTMSKFDRLKTKEIHPEFYGKLTRQERRAITPQGFAKAFYEANH